MRTPLGRRTELCNTADTRYASGISEYLTTRRIPDTEAVTQDVFVHLSEQL